MAATYTVVTQYAGIDTIGGTQTVDVVFVGITTKPHGTYIEFPVDKAVYSHGIVDAAATSYAGIIEYIWGEPNVGGVQWTQVVNASNLLESSLIITVMSTSLKSSATLTVAITDIGPDVENHAIEELSAELTIVENL